MRTQLLQTLQDEGLERIPVLGLPYDPHISEAVETQPVDDPEHHHVVVKELLRGYRLNGRVARASRVIVGEHAGPAARPVPQPRRPTRRPHRRTRPSRRQRRRAARRRRSSRVDEATRRDLPPHGRGTQSRKKPA